MFERFTASARGVVAAAHREASQFGHHYIGTEHLLLGLMVPGPGGTGATTTTPANTVGKVLAAHGFSAEPVRREIVRLVGPCGGGLGEDEAEALHSIGVDLDAVRSKLETAYGEGVLDQPHGGPAGARLPLTPRAKKVLALSLRQARQLGHHSLGPEHICLGLIGEGHGIAAQILAARTELSVLRDRLMDELASPAA